MARHKSVVAKSNIGDPPSCDPYTGAISQLIGSRSNTTTSAPSAANASAVQRPLREPPTTMARSDDMLRRCDQSRRCAERSCSPDTTSVTRGKARYHPSGQSKEEKLADLRQDDQHRGHRDRAVEPGVPGIDSGPFLSRRTISLLLRRRLNRNEKPGAR
jgi:hypothetical protein